MTVLPREVGTSVLVRTGENILVTLVAVRRDHNAATLLISRWNTLSPGNLSTNVVETKLKAPLRIDNQVKLTLVELDEKQARLGIEAPKHASVDRLETYLGGRHDIDLTAANRQVENKGDADDGLAGSRVPATPKPRPPSLSIALLEPRPA